MPELPDILLYLHALAPRIVGRRVEKVRLVSPFLLRSINPPLSSVEGKTVVALHRLGKRLVLELDDELFLVLHLMIAGRLRWKDAGARVPGKVGLLAIDFAHATLVLTEAGTKRQASLHVVSGRDALQQHDPGGIDVLEVDLAGFSNALRQDNHTLKRALTDPHLFSGIGNAYSDEILHAARLSPFKQTGSLSDDEYVVSVANRAPVPAVAPNGQAATRHFEITMPPDGATYLIDPTLRMEFQTIPFRAVGYTGQLQWTVDERRLGSSQSISWPLERGTHVVRARDARGHLAESAIVVK